MFGLLVSEACEAAATDVGDVVGPAAAEGVLAVAAARERADAALLAFVWSVLRTEVWKADGASSPVPWLRNRTTMSSAETRATIRAGRLVGRFERLAKLLAAGDVSADHVRALARVAIAARMELVERDLDLLCDLGTQLSVDDYSTVLARWASYADDILGRGGPGEQFDKRSVSIRFHDGLGELVARGPAVDIAEIQHHLDQTAPPDPATRTGGRRRREQRRYDALCELVGQGAAAKAGGRHSGPDRAFTLIADDTTFHGGFNPGGCCETSNGITVPPTAAQRFACDSVIRGLAFDDAGEILYYGRARRLFSPPQRAAVITKYRTCASRDCDVASTDCQVHHLDFYDHGGPTDITNALPLCSYEHHLVHDCGWTLQLHDDGTCTLIPP